MASIAPTFAASGAGPRGQRPTLRQPTPITNTSVRSRLQSSGLFDRTIHAEVDVMTRRPAATPPTTAAGAGVAADDGDTPPSDATPQRSAHVVFDRGTVSAVTPGATTATVVLHRLDGVDVTVQIAQPTPPPTTAPPTTVPAAGGASLGGEFGASLPSNIPPNIPPDVRDKILKISRDAATQIADLVRPYLGGSNGTASLPKVGDDVVAYNLDNAATSKLAPATTQRGAWALYRAYHGLVIRADDGTTPDQPPTDPATPPTTPPTAWRTYLFDRGVVSATAADSVTMTRPDATTTTFGVAADTKIVLFRPRLATGTLSDVNVGDRAATILADTGATYVLDFGTCKTPPTTAPPTTAPATTLPPTTDPVPAPAGLLNAILANLIAGARR